jgi:uncharacterized lipoprotein YmbA
MNLRHPSLLLALLLTTGIGAGCLNLKPQPDRTRFYVLSSPATDLGQAPSTQIDALPVFLGRVEIPDYLNNSAIATRLSETGIQFSHHHHWAEPLREGATRVLRDALAARCGPDRVHPANFRRPGGLYLEAQVALTAFECTADGSAVVAARWSILRQPGSKEVARGDLVSRHEFTSPPADYSKAVEALSRCLGDLGVEISAHCLEPSEP